MQRRSPRPPARSATRRCATAGTIGGNVAHADPASDLPTVLCALGATFGVTGAGGNRTVDAADFFQGVMTTALGANDLLTAIEVPAQAGQGSAYAKFAHPASRYAVVGAAAAIGTSGGSCSSAAVAVGGLVPTPVRAVSVEQALDRPGVVGREHLDGGRCRRRRPGGRPARRYLCVS